uniref:Uncharacterized protein n=1 Tax=Caenorhabditis japonica TaxID=281687 RepID=A0A8R1ELG2_CAEJA
MTVLRNVGPLEVTKKWETNRLTCPQPAIRLNPWAPTPRLQDMLARSSGGGGGAAGQVFKARTDQSCYLGWTIRGDRRNATEAKRSLSIK